MPELPEVTTTVNGLQHILPGSVITDVWTDLNKKNQPIKQFKYTIKDDSFFKRFKKIVIGQKILKVERRAKNILIQLENKETILIHLKMTGHLLFGEYIKKQVKNEKVKNKIFWESKYDGPLRDPYNRFVHVLFTLRDKKNNVKHLAFCDARKFGKVTLLSVDTSLETVGPEPLDPDFSFEKFSVRLNSKSSGKIKTVLMDQTVVAGVGNIYSDEALWLAGVHPESIVKKIPKPEMKNIFTAMKRVLLTGIDFGGDSTSDYRDIDGNPGRFHHRHNVYRKKGETCGKKGCSGVILRKVINGRSAHFCPTHQHLYS